MWSQLNSELTSGKRFFGLLKIIRQSSVRLHNGLKDSILLIFVSCAICHFTCTCKCMHPVLQNLLFVTKPALPLQSSSTSVMQEHMTDTRPSGTLDFCPFVHLLLCKYNRDFCLQVSMYFLLHYTDADKCCSCILTGLSHTLAGLHAAYNIF